ncbi:uncharacterized protein LOC119688115 [Teleopsis dalmanni]|uniref:uncharacterized protein LOC119688115 n=1 Tax=Teleopsis dalmanni TaxID=139649 RepID=UPI0018CE1F16|nr:uncharacterized protein LOC119688115 [Teleopsis dalmanni]
MMGCSSSMDTSNITEEPVNGLARWQQMSADPVSIVKEYVRLDEKISKLESTCPGPRMATAEAWVEHLQTKRNSLLGMDGMEVVPKVQQPKDELSPLAAQRNSNEDILVVDAYDTPTTALHVAANPTPFATKQQNGVVPIGNGVGVVARHGNDIVTNTPTQDLANLALNLGVVGDVNKASTHEDFFANLSESALHLISLRYFTEILDHTKVRLKAHMESYAALNELYVNQDGIIAFISGGTYMSRLEESLDSQLETARDVRDKLGSALEQWHICGTLLRACANSATQCLHQWRKVAKIVNPKDKIQAALECRNTLQASLISLECAQLSLPHVEIKYVSNRQILAVKHCNVYIITDIANLARYEHTSKVLAAYESNMSKGSTWLYETFNKTLRKDFDKAEETVRNLSKTLREHREEMFTAARS